MPPSYPYPYRKRAPSQITPRPRTPAPKETLYFAFGTNLSLTQMADRCPDSRFIGRAVLRGHRWQINQRGHANIVANIVANADRWSRVEGLVYLLTAADEAALDSWEGGVAVAAHKTHVDVELFSAHPTLVGRKVVEVVDHAVRLVPEASNPRGLRKDRSVSVMTYVDGCRVVDGGVVLPECVQPLSRGLDNASLLGLPERWMHEVVYPVVRPRATQTPNQDRNQGQCQGQCQGQNQNQTQITTDVAMGGA